MNELHLLERLGRVAPVDPDLMERTAAALADARDAEPAAWPTVTVTPIAKPAAPMLPVRRPPAVRWVGRVAAVAAAVVLAATVGVLLRPGSAGGPPSAAAAELHQLAQVAADQPAADPPGPGQFMYTSSQEAYTSSTYQSDGKSFTVSLPETRQIWIGPDGSGRLLETFGQAVFLSPQDQADWVAAGSPGLAQAPSDDVFGPGGLSDGPRDLATLPTDPTALAALFAAGKVEGGPPGPAEEFTQIGDLLRETDASPALRSALYQVAAGLPGVDMMGAVADHAGRPGVGIAYVSAGTRHELIFDPYTSALLGEEDVIVDPSATTGMSRYPAGTLMDWVVYLQSGIVDSTGAGPSSTVVPPSPDSGGAPAAATPQPAQPAQSAG